MKSESDGEGPLQAQSTTQAAVADRATAGLLAGAVAGVANVLTGHPLDTLKVLAQTGQREGVLGAARSRLRVLQLLYRGVGPPLLTSALNIGITFGAYEAALQGLQPLDLPLSLDVFLAGTASGVFIAAPTLPLMNVRVLMQTDGGKKGNSVAWMRRLWVEGRPGGTRSLYRGFWSAMVHMGIGRGNYMLAFHLVKQWEGPSGILSSESFAGKVLAASCAGVYTWVATYPFDTARVRIVRDWRGEHGFTGSPVQGLWKIAREGGIRKLYVGLWYTVVRAAPVAAATLTTYDFAKMLLGAS